MKTKMSPAEFISIITLGIIGILWIISVGLQIREEHNREEAENIAYTILESAKLTHMNMNKNETITFTEESYFDGNDKNHGPFILTLDKYNNSNMQMWVDSKYCVTKKVTDTEFTIDDSKTSERTCLIKENTVHDLLSNFDLVNDIEKTGLDKNNPWASKKYYAGKNPSNYVVFSNSCFRIISISENNSIKLVYDGPVTSENTCQSYSNQGIIGEFPWDETNSNDWNKPASLRNMIEIWDTDKNVNNIIQSLDTTKLVKPNWYIGKTKENKDVIMQDIISSERSSVADKSYYIGLLNISDYLKSSSNTECNELNKKITKECKLDNYLYDGNKIWFLNTTNDKNYKNHAYQLQKDGSIILKSTIEKGNIRPVIYLNDSVKLMGSGRNSSPYIVS